MTASNPPSAGGPAVDPSMEDILASIRRILSEDDGEGTPPAHDPHAVPTSDVLALDPSMLVDEPQPLLGQSAQHAEPQFSGLSAARPAPHSPVEPAAPVPEATKPVHAEQSPPTAPTAQPATPPLPQATGLVGDVATAAAASSVGSLLRTLASERQNIAVSRNGPTLEDLVREEMRPLLKQWLDTNLPPMVERLVRAEIERVVGRALS